MKKLIAILLALLMLSFALVSCQKEENEKDPRILFQKMERVIWGHG